VNFQIARKPCFRNHLLKNIAFSREPINRPPTWLYESLFIYFSFRFVSVIEIASYFAIQRVRVLNTSIQRWASTTTPCTRATRRGGDEHAIRQYQFKHSAKRIRERAFNCLLRILSRKQRRTAIKPGDGMAFSPATDPKRRVRTGKHKTRLFRRKCRRRFIVVVVVVVFYDSTGISRYLSRRTTVIVCTLYLRVLENPTNEKHNSYDHDFQNNGASSSRRRRGGSGRKTKSIVNLIFVIPSFRNVIWILIGSWNKCVLVRK